MYNNCNIIDIMIGTAIAFVILYIIIEFITIDLILLPLKKKPTVHEAAYFSDRKYSAQYIP